MNKKVKYKPPVINKKKCYVPIVCKNKDFLVGYIKGVYLMTDVFESIFQNMGLNLKIGSINSTNLCLDSTRYNDILHNDVRESDLTDEEVKEYFDYIVEQKKEIFEAQHPDTNADILRDNFLNLECTCGLGFYFFKKPEDVPDNNFKCKECDRTLIDYTDKNDEDFIFDGE
jgi:hypothetical protein